MKQGAAGAIVGALALFALTAIPGAQAGKVLLRRGDFTPRQSKIAASVMRQAAGHDRIREP